MSDKTTTFSVSVPEKLKQKTDDRISSGDFSGVSDYVRWLIRNDLENQKKLENLRVFVQEGADALARGEYTELNQELIDDIKAQGRAARAGE
jgi:putative addiction module CopG family antidote